MQAIETNKNIVLSVGADGIRVAVNGANKHISWDALVAAARQGDSGLAVVYQGVLRQARLMAADGPVEVSVERDSSNVWWVASVRAAYGGGEANYSRRADEGCTLPNHLLAACEAHDICERLGGRVVCRIGFDGLAAKAKARSIVSR